MDDWLDTLPWAEGLIDWSDPTLTPDAITRVLVGKQSHRKQFPNLTHVQVEINILREAGRDNWYLPGPFGKPLYQHFLTLIKLLLPERDITPFTHDAVLTFCNVLGRNGKLVNMIGSQSSGKSFTIAALGLAVMVIDPEYTTIKVANPADKSADSTIFGDFRSVYNEMKMSNPDLFPDSFEYRDKFIEFVRVPKFGKIEQKSVRNIGLHKGVKAKDKNRKRGVILHCVDEVNEIPSAEESYMTILSNMVSQEGFISITSQNFTSQDNLGGILAAPRAPFPGNPATYEEIIADGPQRNVRWHCMFNGVTLRARGPNSPNILSGQDLYPYLFTKRNLQTMKDNFGEGDPRYLSQVEAFPVGGDEALVVLTKTVMDSSRVFDTNFLFTDKPALVSFLDPAFSVSGDMACYSWASFGDASIVLGDGSTTRQPLLVFHEPPARLPLKHDMRWDEYWISRITALGIDPAVIEPGGRVTMEDQLVIQTLERNRKRGIPASMFGYDPSLRADIVASIIKFMGTAPTAIDYRAKPRGFFFSSQNKMSEDCCYNQADEACFGLADLFAIKSIRGGEHLRAAMVQLNRTRYDFKAGKYRLEDKADTRARLGQSPDQRDAAAGCATMARIRGFSPGKPRQGAANSDRKSLFDKLASAAKFKPPTTAKLRY